MAFTKGDAVVQVVTPITGRVAGWSVDSENGTKLVLVEWTDAEGVDHSRYFNEDEIQAPPPAA